MSQRAGQPVVVDNRLGANGIIAAHHVARAPADGYTILIGTNTTHATNQSLYKKLPYSVERDFEPITLLSQSDLTLVVRSESPYRSLTDLINAMRLRPQQLTFASGSASSRAASALLTAQPLIRSGKVRALAITSANRSLALPNIPTIREVLNTDYEISAWVAAYAPAGTPPDRISRLNNLLQTAAGSEKIQELVRANSGRIVTSTPAQLREFTHQETIKWASIIQTAEIEPE